MSDQPIETLKALSLDIEIMFKILTIAEQSINLGLEAAKIGQLNIAEEKILEICDVLEKTSVLFTITLNKHKSVHLTVMDQHIEMTKH